MESMRENWTDKRLDDLNHKVDAGFERGDADIRGLRVEMRTEFGALRGEMKSGFDRTDARFDRIDERFERMNGRFEALHRLLVQSAVVLLAALVGLHFV
jgi:tetrahydromethanopterin S-methyltransferase subunit G